MTTTNDTLSAALDYLSRGWRVIDLPHKSKRPGRAGWPNEQLTEQDVRSRFQSPKNIGILLGDASNGLIDIDIDSVEARRIARMFLPATNAVFGRRGAPESHWLYYTDTTDLKRKPFFDPTKNADNHHATLIELRANGSQTLFPPSVHPDGEDIVWADSATPTHVDIDTLRSGLNRLAAAALLARHWPTGGRHEATGALAGALSRAGWTFDEVNYFIRAVTIAAGDEEARDREAFILDTFTAVANSEPTTGWPRLSELIKEETVTAVRLWLNMLETSGGTKFPLSDLGNAERLEAKFGDKIRYDAVNRRWMIWDGTRWQMDAKRLVYAYAKEVIREIPTEAKSVADPDMKKKIFNWALRSEDQRRIDSLVDVAGKTGEKIKVEPEELDSDPWILNCLDGTIDLRTGTLTPHNQDNLITKIVPANYSYTADCPEFLAFLNFIFGSNQELIRFVQKAIGYTLTGVVQEKAVFICYGPTDTGKSTLLADILQTLMNDYAKQIDEKTISLTKTESIPTDIAELKGARLGVVSEPREGMQLNEARVKAMTGRNRLKGRMLYGDPFEFNVSHKLWIDTNHKPSIRETSDAIWNRIKLIPFEIQIPKSKQDPQFGVKIKKEFPGILRWAVEGCLAWQLEGLGLPPTIQEATDEYRQDMDTFGRFLNECCIISPDAHIQSSDLYDTYKDWAHEIGERSILSQKIFTMRLKERVPGLRTTNSKGVRFYGITVLEEKRAMGIVGI
jgi:putative DNA primase/helicase